MELKDILNAVNEDYKKTFGDELVSIIVYGSAAGYEYIPKRSDINLLIVLTEEGIQKISSAIETVNRWKKKRVTTPLFLTEDEIKNSLDTFPVEYINIKFSYRVLYGKDIFAELEFNREFIRLQCERELRAKIIILRGAILDTGVKEGQLKSVLIQSLKAFIAIFRAVLYLEGKDIPVESRRIIKEISSISGIREEIFLRLLDLKEDKIKLRGDALRSFSEDYLRESRKLVRFIDIMGG